MTKRIVYSRGFPYGAPLVMIRGGATKDSEVKAYLKEEGFRWQMSDRPSYAWEHYLHRDDLARVLKHLRDELGCEIAAKDGMDEGYVIELDEAEAT